jgi:hypothetical protein
MLKKGLAILCLCGLSTFAKAQLTIYQGLKKTGTSQVCMASGLYIGNNIPGGLNNNFNSIVLTKGYMATLAEHEDGTGSSFCYVAAISDADVDLSAVLQNRVSFIRVLPIGVIKKKGAGNSDNNLVAALKPSWFYDWGTSDVSTTDRQYVPLTFGIYAATDLTRVAAYTAKTDVNCLSGFNEPNNTTQGNIPDPAKAVIAYKNLLRTGYRMGSPATTEEQYNGWLNTFIDGANTDTIRVDYIAIHWYDWGEWSRINNPSPNAADVLTRFKNYINNVYTLYHRPIWITEFNANPNRTTATQQAFMTLALDYLETDSRVERYAFFFPNSSPASNSGTFSALTPLGQIYSDHVSTASYTANIIDTRTTNIASSNLNLALNGDFELYNTTSNAQNFDSWTESNADMVPETGTGKINGNASVRFVGASTSTSFPVGTPNPRILTASAGIPVSEGKTYRFSFKCRVASAAGNSSSTSTAITNPSAFSGDVYNYTGNVFSTSPLARVYTNSVTDTTISVNYLVPIGSGINTVRIKFTKTEGIAYLDDVSLVEVKINNALPITLSSFSGNVNTNGINLNWKTASEINNNYFKLYHSTNGKEFSEIAKVVSLGNDNSFKSYNFLDKFPVNGVNYYKLSQTDLDGKTEVFDPIAINFTLKDQHNLTVYSNPFQTKFSLSWALNELVTVNIFDTFGKKLFNNKNLLNAGDNLVTLNTLKQLNPNQIYVLTVNGLTDKLAVKFVVNSQ